MIRVEELTKKFKRNQKEFLAVNHVFMKVEKGEFVGVIGHSGSGKTTLFNMLAGLIKPTIGKIYIDGKEITSMPADELADYRNQRMGYILQGNSLLNNFTVLDNVCMPAYLSTSKKGVQEKAKKMLQDMGVGHLEKEFPGNLSGGEIKRVSIARAMINEPSIILADEPTSNLDSVNSKKVMELLRKISDRGTTVLLSTHELEYLDYTDYKLEMKNGSVSE